MEYTLYKELTQTKKEDWVNVKGRLMMYKKPIRYTPTAESQSWTYNYHVAFSFADEWGYVWITKQDSDFFMNDKALKIIRNQVDEHEIIHIGKTFSHPTYLAINFDDWKRIFETPIMPGKKGYTDPEYLDVLAQKVIPKKQK